MALYPYLYFSGTCREAMTRYQEVFGGELDIMSNADAPPGEGMGAEHDDLIMHAALILPDGDMLMASDDPSGDGGPKRGVSPYWGTTDADEARRVFEALAEGGEVQMPYGEVFWAPGFGTCIDRFGVPWMIGAEPAEAPAPSPA